MSLTATGREYSTYTFKELVREQNDLVVKIHQEFINGHGLDQCFKSLSPQQSAAILSTIRNLGCVLEELNNRRNERNTACLGVSYNVYLIGVKVFLHFFFLSSIILDLTSIFLDCEKAVYVEIASISCATAAVAFAILNKWGEDKLARMRQDLARLENCSVHELFGIKQLNQFLNSFVELVTYLQIEKAKKEGANSSSGASDDFEFRTRLPAPQATLNYLSSKAVDFGLKTSKKDLMNACISSLRAVPDYILEKYAGENAAIIREKWINQIAALAKIKYKASKPDKRLDVSSSFVEPNHSIEVDVSKFDPATDLNKLSLTKLIELYQEEIIKFHEEFNLDVYLSSLASEEQTKEMQQHKQKVDGFIGKLKNLQKVIRERGKVYERTHCIPCVSTKRKQDILYGTKHIFTVIFFGATSISCVTHCVEGFDVRDGGKVVAVIAGLFSMFLEGLCSWTTSRDVNNKIERASLINADIFDLEGFDDLNYFVDSFLFYAEQVQELKLLIPRYNDPGSDKLLKHELREKVKTAKAALEQCEDILKAMDNQFLEQLVKGNGNKIKEEWLTSLRMIFDKLIESISFIPNDKTIPLIQRKNSLGNLSLLYADIDEDEKEEISEYEINEPFRSLQSIKLKSFLEDRSDGDVSEEESDEEILFDNEYPTQVINSEEVVGSDKACAIQ